MEGCGVCVYSGYEGEYSDFFTSRVRRARKAHKCYECNRTIQPGEKYAYAAGKSDGTMWTVRCCLICDEIADAFCCDGRLYGNFWSDFYEVVGSLTTACFDRLKTPEAKAELRRYWMEWKGLIPC